MEMISVESAISAVGDDPLTRRMRVSWAAGSRWATALARCCSSCQRLLQSLIGRPPGWPYSLLLGIALQVCLLLAPALTHGQDYGAVTVSAIRSVYDGDTLRVDIGEWPAIVGANIAVRVRGVDTPEIRGKCPTEKVLAKQARDYVRALLTQAQQIELHTVARGKYFRLVADVVLDGQSLATLLIQAGHGRPYGGGKRQGWCE